MVKNTKRLEERNPLTLVLGFCHYSYSSAYIPLAFELKLRVHIDDGFAQSQNHKLNYLKILQL